MLDIPAGIGSAIGFLVCIVAHEVATAYAANATGDRTPRLHGRLTVSPKAHADIVGSYILPGIFIFGFLFSSPLAPLFGWGKRHALGPMRRSPLVPLAGPAATLAIAFAAGLSARAGGGEIAVSIAIVACYLTVVELLPIPGRDGGRVLQGFLSPSAASTIEDLEKYEIAFLLVLFLFLGGIVNNMAGSLFDLVVPAAQISPIIG